MNILGSIIRVVGFILMIIESGIVIFVGGMGVVSGGFGPALAAVWQNIAMLAVAAGLVFLGDYLKKSAVKEPAAAPEEKAQ